MSISESPVIPRWFLITLASCVVIATFTLIYSAYDRHHRARYTFHSANGVTAIMDSRTGAVCSVAREGSPDDCTPHKPSLSDLAKKYGVKESTP